MIAAAIIRWANAGILFLLFVVYGNLSEIGVRYYSLPSLFQGLLTVLLVVIFLRILESGLGYVCFDPLMFVFLALILLVFSSSIYAIDSELADEKLVQFLRGLVLFFVLVNLIRTRKHLRQAVWVLILAAAFLAAITVIQFSTSSYTFNFGGLARVKNAQIVRDVFEPRVAGPLSDPNFYAQILVMIVPLVMYRLWDEKKLILRLTAGVSLALILLAIAFTYSRAGAVATGVIIIIASVYRRIKLRLLAAIIAVAIPVILVLPGEFADRLDTLTQILPGQQTSVVKVDTSFQERTLLMETAWEIFKDHPVLGVGAGNFTRHFDSYAHGVGSNISSYDGFDKQRFTHSLYLETAAELGVSGLILLLLIGGISFCYAVSAARRFSQNGDAYSAGVAAALALSLVGYAMTSFFLHGGYLQYLWLLVALATVARRIAVKMPDENKIMPLPHRVR
jgi:O-antigen ligase